MVFSHDQASMEHIRVLPRRTKGQICREIVEMRAKI